jgi:hypothetical protein
VKAGCKQRAEHGAKNGADDRIAGEGTSAGGATDEFISAKAKSGSDDNSNDDAQNHNASHV